MKTATRCNVYISEHYSEIIFAPNHQNKDGIYFEQEQCLVGSFPMSDEELGQTILYCLSSFSSKDLNLRQYKKSDWPAYKQSQSKTIRDFERRYVLISIEAANEYNLIFNAEAFPGYSDDLAIKTFFSLNQQKDEIGKKIQTIYNQCSQIQIRDKKESI